MKTRNLIFAVSGIFLMSCTQVRDSGNEELNKNFRKHAREGVMATVPASPEGQVTLQNWNTQPYSKWAFRNPGIHPSMMVPRGGQVFEFEKEIRNDLENWKVQGNEDISILQALEGDDTDGFIVIKDGVIVYERYFGDFKETDPHIWASSTKSMVGMVAGIMIEDSRLDPELMVSGYLPEMQGSAFGDLSVQQVLNMVSALDYSEDYVDLKPGTVHYEYFRRIGLIPAFDLMQMDPLQDTTPRSNLEFLPTFRTHPEKIPGEVFEYHSPNVDVIGMILTRISGQPLDELISELVWKKIGAEHDALFMSDVGFNPVATGGYASTLRDFARFGYAVLNDGKIGSNQVFPSGFIRETMDLNHMEYAAGQMSLYRNDVNAPAYDKHLQGYKNFWWIHDADREVMTPGESMARVFTSTGRTM